MASPEFSHQAVEDLLKSDPSLIYKLLRYLNSPLPGLRGEVPSVREAITLLSEIEFRRWISILAIVSMASDKPPELIRTALTRAFFCEVLSHPAGLSHQSSNLFLMGLLSITDAILDRHRGNSFRTPGFPSSPLRPLRRRRPPMRRARGIASPRTRGLALSAAAKRLDPVEGAIPDCQTKRPHRAAALTS